MFYLAWATDPDAGSSVHPDHGPHRGHLHPHPRTRPPHLRQGGGRGGGPRDQIDRTQGQSFRYSCPLGAPSFVLHDLVIDFQAKDVSNSNRTRPGSPYKDDKSYGYRTNYI